MNSISVNNYSSNESVFSAETLHNNHSSQIANFGKRIVNNEFQRFKVFNNSLVNIKNSKELLDFIRINIDDFNEINIATAFGRLAHTFEDEKRVVDQCEWQDKDLLGKLQSKVCESFEKSFNSIQKGGSLKTFGVRELANLSWAFAKLKLKNSLVFSHIAWFSMYNIDLFKSKDLAQVPYAFATLGMKDEQLFEHIASASLNIIDTFNNQDIANITWAFATAGIENKALFETIAKVILNKLDTFDSERFVNILWAFAALNIKNDGFLKKIVDEISKDLNSLDGKGLANLSWALAKCGIKNEFLLKGVAETSLKKIEAFNVKEVKSSPEKLDGFNAHALTSLSWGFATLGIRNEALFNAIALAAVKDIDTFSIQAVTTLFWAFGATGVRSEKLFKVTEKIPLEKLQESNVQGLANIAWAFALFGIRDLSLFKKIATVSLEKKQSEFNSQSLINLLWAFVLVDVVDENEPFVMMLVDYIKTINGELTEINRLMQLKQAHLFLTRVKNKKISWDKTFLDTIERHALEGVKQFITPSKLHEDVARELTNLGIKFSQEHIDKLSCYVINIALIERGVALTIDGPCRFIGNTREYNQISKFKNIILKACGWKVVHIPYFIWDSLKGKDKGSFLKRLLSLQVG